MFFMSVTTVGMTVVLAKHLAYNILVTRLHLKRLVNTQLIPWTSLRWQFNLAKGTLVVRVRD